MTGNVSVLAGTATGNSDSGAEISGASIDIGSAGQSVQSLTIAGGNNTVNSAISHTSNSDITGTTAVSIYDLGNFQLTGGSALVTSGSGASSASALLSGGAVTLNITET
jgi:hypothetical protein